LGIYPKEYKSMYKRNTCIPVFIAALVTITKVRCPKIDEWI
jgi:hypothetical protein